MSHVRVTHTLQFRSHHARVEVQHGVCLREEAQHLLARVLAFESLVDPLRETGQLRGAVRVVPVGDGSDSA